MIFYTLKTFNIYIGASVSNMAVCGIKTHRRLIYRPTLAPLFMRWSNAHYDTLVPPSACCLDYYYTAQPGVLTPTTLRTTLLVLQLPTPPSARRGWYLPAPHAGGSAARSALLPTPYALPPTARRPARQRRAPAS